MYKQIPHDTGHVMLDAAYPCKANCNVIKASGLTPVICPKSNMKPKKFNAPALMLKWHEEDPDGFDKLYHQRSLDETAFSVTREIFGANTRAKSVCQGVTDFDLEAALYTQAGRHKDHLLQDLA